MAGHEDNTLDAETLALFANAPERFVRKLRREGECVVWHGPRQKWGYGRVVFERKQWGAHRLAYTLHYGAIPEGMHVLHYCDNPSCVNPNHLWLGTNMQNRQDSVAKGRHAYGSRITQSKLSPEQVAEIRERYKNGERQPFLASCYGVAQSTISKIVRQYRWSSVPSESDLSNLWVDSKRGERSPCAKLTEQKVREIRAKYASGEMQKTLAAEYGVSKGAILSVVHRKTWTHLD